MATTQLAFDLIARDRASDKFDKIGRAASSSTGKLKTFAKAGALAVAAGAAVAGKALFDMTKAAAADEAAQKRLALQLKNSAKATDGQVASVERWITAQGKALGVADDELRPALSKLVTVTKDVGKAQKLTSLAMDVSAGTGKSLTSVTDALMKAQNGSLGGLARLGVATKDAAGETLSLDQVTKNLAKTYEGQAAKAADTTEGKFKRLNVMWDEAKEAIGERLLPIALKLADWMLDDFGPAAQKVGDWIQKNLIPPLLAVGKWVAEKVIPPLKELGEKIMEQVRGSADDVKGAFQDMQPFFELVGNFVVNVLIPAFNKLAENVVPVLVFALKGIGKALGAIGSVGRWLWNNVLVPVFDGFSGLLENVLDAIADMLGALSNVPGFGWLEDVSDGLHNAADAAGNFKDKIDVIPSRKEVRIDAQTMAANKNIDFFMTKVRGIPASKTMTIYTNLVTRGDGTGNAGPGLFGENLPGNARGTGFFRGGMTVVGEEGPELVRLPRGSRIYDAARSQAMVREGAAGGGIDYRELADALVRALRDGLPVVQLHDAGQAAYVGGATY